MVLQKVASVYLFHIEIKILFRNSETIRKKKTYSRDIPIYTSIRRKKFQLVFYRS